MEIYLFKDEKNLVNIEKNSTDKIMNWGVLRFYFLLYISIIKKFKF